MVSNLRSETARANGAKSRGPITAEGKEKSSRNAIKHGLTAGNGNILLDCEDPAQFDEVLDKLLGIHEPATPAEIDILEEMVAARWRIRRMMTIETGLLNAEILSQQSKSDNPDPTIHLASAFRSLIDDSRSLALASRYEARLQRLYDRSYKTLRELQQARRSEEPTPPSNIRIHWFNPSEEPDQPTESGPPAPEPELPNEPTAGAPLAQPPSPPPTPRSSAPPAWPELPNEPTGGPASRPTDPRTTPFALDPSSVPPRYNEK